MSEMKFEGLDSLIERFEAIGDIDTVNANLAKACALVERAAKQKAPKGDGDLRRSIQSKIEDGVGVVFTPLEYAPYVEYGTGLFAEKGGRTDAWHYQDDEGKWHTTIGMHPSPYMRPALEENRDNIIKLLKEGITE